MPAKGERVVASYQEVPASGKCNHQFLLIMYRIFAQLCLLLMPGFIMAQSLSGVIIDARTGEPVSNVSVSIAGATSTTSTESGAYRFDELAEMPEEVSFEKEGFVTMIVPLRGEKSILNVRMSKNEYITEEVFISALRASDKTATSYATVTKEDIQRMNFGQDLPFLLDQLPSTVVNSDAGAGVGYTGIRIRGTDPSRTNVTINGIPLNDPESHGVFWVNLPDLSSSVNSIQVQRGVGTSTNGAAAFGASINIETENLNPDPYVTISNSFGSFNTRKHTVNAGTGLINNRFALDARLSQIASDGWVDRASSDLRSYFISAGYYGQKHILKAMAFSGKEVTYQSWWGVPESYLDDPVLRTDNYYTYDNEVDNYGQDHYQLHYSFQPNSDWTVRASAHYTKGGGYFEQFKDGEDFADYGLSPLFFVNANSDTITTTDLIRRRWLDNDFYGAIASLQFTPTEEIDLVLGGGWNQYDGDHFGEIIWAEFAGDTDIRDRYYENRGLKTDVNTYLKGFFDLTPALSGYADLQLRSIDYQWGGIESIETAGVDNDQRALLGDANFLFFNPKVGLTYQLGDKQQVFASFAVANREPVRNDFIDAPEGVTPLPERLNNLEAGYRFESKNFSATVNGFFMDYTNQLVLNGKINDVGSPIRENVADSYRAGIEVVAGGNITNTLSLSGTLALSQNKIASYTESVFNYDDYTTVETAFENTDIAFSPNFIASAQLRYTPIRNLEIALLSKYVGKQYLDNTQNEARTLDAFWVNDLLLSYMIQPQWAKEIRLGLQVKNLLDEQYEPNGYTFSYIFGGETYTENYYYPQAGRHLMANVVFSF